MANEKRLIELDNALLVTVGESFPRPLPEHDEVLLATVRKKLRNLPYVDAVEVVHGWWEQARYTEAPLYICSECDKPEYKQHRYCPNCGAKMDGERKDNE